MGWHVDSLPNSRSIDTVGTSLSLTPSSWARMDISKAQDQPAPIPVNFNLGEDVAPEHFHPGGGIAQRGRRAEPEQGIARARQEMAEQ
jgi:hypothetical protein